MMRGDFATPTGFTDEDVFVIHLAGKSYPINTQDEKRAFAHALLTFILQRDSDIQQINEQLREIYNTFSKRYYI